MGLALAKMCPCPWREAPSRVPGVRLSVISIMSLELAHNENKFCLIFDVRPSCVFLHSYNLVRKGQPYAGPLTLYSPCISPFLVSSPPGGQIHGPILHVERLSLPEANLPNIKFRVRAQICPT